MSHAACPVPSKSWVYPLARAPASRFIIPMPPPEIPQYRTQYLTSILRVCAASRGTGCRGHRSARSRKVFPFKETQGRKVDNWCITGSDLSPTIHRFSPTVYSGSSRRWRGFNSVEGSESISLSLPGVLLDLAMNFTVEKPQEKGLVVKIDAITSRSLPK
ncbi:hypothetical protein B0H17DRAFT_1184515 [Mycena rosella]|uniref:Uncharacterized protein n=1 Tax=Mycena rosella TaxID=1033263 RepID=A0AAD7G7Y2_MYCRO|nr:hypothetical protein B0H17DRAFT_1184515 [Mycena rosella]